MDLNERALLLGQIISNFQSLEFALRASLYKLHRKNTRLKLDEMKVGDIVDLNELTDYSKLKKLIQRYNNEVVKNDQTLTLDKDLVELRDALAHGRVSCLSENDNLRIIKFEEPKNGKVKVSFSEEMTESWLKKQKKRVYEALMKTQRK